MKIRVFALAKELGLDSKELIEYCNQAGIQVKSSALASISPEERDTVLRHIEQHGSTSRGASHPAVTPVREMPPVTSGKVRQLDMPRRPLSPTRPLRAGEESGGVAVAEPRTAIAVAEPPTVAAREQMIEPEVAAEPDELDAEPALADEAPAETPSAGADGAAPAVQAEALPSDGDQVEAEAAAGEGAAAGEAQADSDGALTPQDYVSASGAGARSIRSMEMRPRGTIPESDQARARRQQKKPRPASPLVAAPPAYKAPKPRKEAPGAPAQKPDLPLTPEALDAQSPLKDRLRRTAEKRKRGEVEAPIDVRGRRKLTDLEEDQKKVRRPKRGRQVSDEAAAEERRRGSGIRRKRRISPVEHKTFATIALPLTVRSLSEALGRPANTLIKLLWERGQMVTINDPLAEDAVLELALDLGVDLRIKRDRDIEQELRELLETPDSPEALQARPPIVTILGHVDHGKTSLLDKIRSANVAAGEAGGITQHIAAYQVERNDQKVTFVDTPGHAAFGQMRARGANVTDIVVLVVAVDDGVMPQTVECISHAKSAGVPIIVALNKIDLPDVNEPKALQELAANGLLPAEWGGDTEIVRTSAVTGQGLDQLLETILITAELQEEKGRPIKASADRAAVGVCLEAFRDEGRGVLAWLIVQKGTLNVGDVVTCGEAFGRVRAMYNDRDEEVREVGPSTPVKVAGFDEIPDAGQHFFVLEDIEAARRVAELRQTRGRTEQLAQRGRPRTLEDILNAARGGAVQDLPLIVKADTPGSLEALRGEIGKFEHPEVRVQIVHEGVGGVNESDVALASASGAIILAFHVIAEDRAQQLAEREGVDIRRYQIIYEVTEQIKRSLEGLLQPERVEVPTGRALVLQTFSISRYGTIAGCRVLNGTIERSNRVHVIRDQTVLNDYNIASLKREKDDVREVREGMECGIRLDGFNDVKQGDLLEAYRVDLVKRTLD
ncbi:MAG TPA: translation initiation factor IF-2 [Planctomycetaceae bacterium]|nr:translation initiation factor IF-2 [Planctomycetaceae bacterium]